jgi:anti-sigma factor RsiW
MSCELYDDVLSDYVDGVRAADRRGDERFAAFERHLAHCTRCQALVTDFTNIRQVTSTLDEHVPPPRLWAKIASSIEDQQNEPWWQRALGYVFPVQVPALAAATIAIAIAGATWIAWREAAAPVDTRQQVSTPSSEPSTVPAEQHYDEAIAGLQQLADTQNTALDPKTRAVLRQNLAVIDRAINESRAALAQEPGSAAAQDSLLDALETKVALLQDTVALASETAGLPDEAAGAAKELNQ